MTGNIPNLWPEDLAVEFAVTPKAILNRQALVITEKTKEKVCGHVSTKVLGRDFTHTLALVSPTLDDYRHFVIRVRHGIDQFYPLNAFVTESDDKGRYCETEEDFLALLKKVLCHERTTEVVASLVAQSA